MRNTWGTGSEARQGGLFASGRALLGCIVSLLQTRLALVVTEFEEEKLRIVKVLILGVVALFFLCFGFALLSLLVIVFFWDTYRLAAIGLLALVFISIGLTVGCQLRRVLKCQPRPFATTLSELSKDEAALHS